MVRHYIKRSGRVSSPEVIRKAVDHYFSTKDETKNTASLFGIPRTTLRYHVKKMNKIPVPQDRCCENIYVGYAKHRQVFSDFQEHELVKYIQHASRIYFGLSPTEKGNTTEEIYQTHRARKDAAQAEKTQVPHCCGLGVVAGMVFHSGCQGSAGFPHVQMLTLWACDLVHYPTLL